MRVRKETKRQNSCRFFQRKKSEKREKRALFRIHPLFLLVGVWYCFKGELFLFLMSCLVAVQHECAHAFAAAKLGYKLNKIVLMPFGAVIDGDLRGVSFKDELVIALYGPLCNLFTAAFFAAIWWFTPDTYAFTDTACYTSLAIAIVNFLPAYPLDGGRILRCALTRRLLNRHADAAKAQRIAARITTLVSIVLAAAVLLLFFGTLLRREPNLSLLPFSLFIFVGALGNKNAPAAYEKIDFSCKDALKNGVELRRVAVSVHCPIKDVLRYVTPGYYLVLEVYDDDERKRFELPQNELSQYFQRAQSPYDTLATLYARETGDFL
ncbi:MAG: hypothetical protein E7355_02505 [Clostridiales bacterium]|nr:hypothetical protein [Clostridiales bacterium]